MAEPRPREIILIVLVFTGRYRFSIVQGVPIIDLTNLMFTVSWPRIAHSMGRYHVQKLVRVRRDNLFVVKASFYLLHVRTYLRFN